MARRGGFTLVELLVVTGLILVLTALAVGVAYSGILDSHKLTSGSDKLSGWLLQARAKAIRNQWPNGIRLVVTGNFITECQPIEAPEPFNPNPNGSSSGYRLVILRRQNTNPEIHIVGGNAANLTTLGAEIGIGDTLTLTEFGTLHRISGFPVVVTTLQQLQNPSLPYHVTNNPYVAYPSLKLTVANTQLLPDLGSGMIHPVPPPLGTPVQATFVPQYSTTQFGFQRVPRPTLGETPLQLPSGIAIDRDNSQLPPLVNGNYDILFGANGEVMNAGNQGRIVLWMRNPSYNRGADPRFGGDLRVNYEAAGEMALITVYSKTGAIATHPVQLPQTPGPNPTHDPYLFTKDGINSGL
jgi:prepilin-type N-terminal cleavage/methylation domain-containing protein